MSELRLFIGGVADGRMLVTNDCAAVNFPIPGDGGFGCQQYRREVLAAGERQYIVYVVDDIPGADVIGRLIAGYSVGQVLGLRAAMTDLLQQIDSCDGTSQLDIRQAEASLRRGG